MSDFEGKRVVVSGGGGALGTAVVQLLVERGAEVHVPSQGAIEAHLLDHTQIRATADVDLTDEAAARAFFGGVGELWASVHLAGGFAMAPIDDTSNADFRRLLEMNSVTAFASCREATRAIRTTGLGGRLVNVGARPALVPTGGMAAYAASKAAVTGMTLSLAEELADEGIYVNAVIPSIIDTPNNRQSMPDADHSRWPGVMDLARTIVFLASPENTCTRGALVPVYGKS